MMISAAFFISPTGHLIHVPLNHISTVIADPERFGLTIEDIRAVYDEYEESLGLEGQARREILLKIIGDSWIRLRRYRNRHWSVTANTFTPGVTELLRGWAEKMLSGVGGFKELDRYMPVKISTMDGEFNCSVGDLAEGTCPR